MARLLPDEMHRLRASAMRDSVRSESFPFLTARVKNSGRKGGEESREISRPIGPKSVGKFWDAGSGSLFLLQSSNLVEAKRRREQFMVSLGGAFVGSLRMMCIARRCLAGSRDGIRQKLLLLIIVAGTK